MLCFSVLAQRQFENKGLCISDFSVVLRKEIKSGVENGVLKTFSICH